MNTTAVQLVPCDPAADPVRTLPSQTAESPAAEKNSYGQILKSSTLIGGASVINIAIGIVRTKAMALLLGPEGFGLVGVYGSISNLAQSIASMGINSSGVRQIAEAVGSGDKERVARTVIVLRRTSIVLGIAGALLLAVLSPQISSLTFGDDRHTIPIVLLSLVVLFTSIAGGQGAILQGMRRISDLAMMGILGTFFGLVFSIPLVYFLREEGVVPALIMIAAMSIVTSWWYSRKVQIQPPSMTASQIQEEAAALLKLGFAFMASGILMMGAAYVIRIMVIRMVGLDGAGFYQAAWTLGGLYAGFILQAMGADFYPRLTAVAGDDAACNRMVNEQAQISLLLAGPGVIATMTFAPLIIALFYTAEFGGAVDVLRWICLGMTFQVITWPMGYIIVAKGRQKLFFWSEAAWTIVNLGLAWLCLKIFGLKGAGVAFCGSYMFHALLIYPIVRRLSGFRWSPENIQTGLTCFSLIAIVFCGFHLTPFWLATTLGTFAVLLSGLSSIRSIANLTPLDRIPRPMAWLWARLKFIHRAGFIQGKRRG